MPRFVQINTTKFMFAISKNVVINAASLQILDKALSLSSGEKQLMQHPGSTSSIIIFSFNLLSLMLKSNFCNLLCSPCIYSFSHRVPLYYLVYSEQLESKCLAR